MPELVIFILGTLITIAVVLACLMAGQAEAEAARDDAREHPVRPFVKKT